MERLRVAEGRRHLELETGRPFFYLAETAWEIFHRTTREEADLILSDRAAKGFTAVQAVALAELDGLGTPNSYGATPLRNNDPLQPNEPYWQHVDWVIARANELGLYVALLPTWGDKLRGEHAIFTVENARGFGRWLGRRYADAGLIWVLGGDRALENDHELRVVRAMADGLAEGDGGAHLRTFHPPGGKSSSRYVHCETWLDFHMQQTGHSRERESWRLHEHDWDLLPVRPFVNGEPPYEAHPNNFRGGEEGWLDQADVRRELYWAICGGAAGFTYGCHAIWQFWEPPRVPKNGPRATWKESLSLPGASQLHYARELVENERFVERVPAPHDFVVAPRTAGQYTIRGCVTRDRLTAFVYVPDCQRVTLRLASLDWNAASISFLNPRDGRRMEGDAVSGEKVVVQPPFDPNGRDWLIMLERAPKGAL